MKRCFLALFVAVCAVVPLQDLRAQGRMLTLEETIEIGIKASTIVGKSREQLKTARQDVLNNYGNFLPNATFSLYTGRNFFGPTPSVFVDPQGRPINQAGFTHEQYTFNIGSSIMLFNWGVNRSSLTRAKLGERASTYDLQYQKDIVTAIVIRQYYDLVRRQNLKTVAEESVVAAERNLQQVEAFFKIGSNTRADVLQARVRLGNTQLDLITATNNEEIAKATLATSLNFGVEEDYSVDGSLEITKVDPNLQDEIAYMLDHRSDLNASRERVGAAKSGVTVAERSRWPTLAASLNYNWNDRVWPENGSFFRENYSWNAGFLISWNIFDRFATKSTILAAKATNRIAEFDLQQAKLDAILEVKTLYLVLRQADERIRVSEGQVNQAQENLRLAEERYRVGAGTILESIEAAAQLTQSQAALVEAKCDYLIAKADLLRATGRKVATN